MEESLRAREDTRNITVLRTFATLRTASMHSHLESHFASESHPRNREESPAGGRIKVESGPEHQLSATKNGQNVRIVTFCTFAHFCSILRLSDAFQDFCHFTRRLLGVPGQNYTFILEYSGPHTTLFRPDSDILAAFSTFRNRPYS